MYVTGFNWIANCNSTSLWTYEVILRITERYWVILLLFFFVAPSLLQQISSLRMTESDEDSSIQLSIEQERKPARSGLIEVISSTESDQSQPQQPKHYLTICPDGNGFSRILQLCVELPGVRSVSQCQLRISEVSIFDIPTVWGEFVFILYFNFIFYFSCVQYNLNIHSFGLTFVQALLYISWGLFFNVVDSTRGCFLLFRMIFSWKLKTCIIFFFHSLSWSRRRHALQSLIRRNRL